LDPKNKDAIVASTFAMQQDKLLKLKLQNAKTENSAQRKAALLILNEFQKRGFQNEVRNPDDCLQTMLPAPFSDQSPTYDAASNVLTVPCIVLYPEFQQADVIATFDVETTFLEQLIPILDSDPLPWDPSHSYRTSTTDIYFGSKDDSSGKSKLIKLERDRTLEFALLNSGVTLVNGVVEVFVLHKQNKASQHFVKNYASSRI
jgi:hypothetical protein